MSKSIALGLLCAGALLLAALLTGCSDEPSPTPSAGAVPTPAVIAQPGVTPVPPPTSTMAPTHTPTPVPTPAAATLSLNVYLTLCAPRDLGLADDLTYGDFSSELAAEADRFEALTPPAQLSEWHLLNIEAYRTTQALVDIQPKDDVADFNSSFLIAVADDFGEKLSEAAARVPKDVRQPMIEAGCIYPADVPDDNEDVPYDYEDVPDDHGNDIDDATMAVVTVDVGGALDYVGDIDYFRFTAEEGQFYQIDVALGSLPDSVLALLNPDGWELAYNDNHGDSLASRVLWEAPASGDYYLVVEASGFDADVGTYTLTVSHSTIVDDHGNDIDDATVAAVGADVEGAIGYLGDTDYFRFAAEEGQIYQIDVALGTLDDSVLALLNPDGWELAYNDDHGDSWASRVVWLAPESGVYYLVVESSGFDADVGTYTLTVSHSTIVDDHGDDVDDATAIRVGADVQGALDYDGDIDYFRFQAERGESYQIDVALGTLDESAVYLYDTDGSYLDASYDYGDPYASRLYWEAPSSGERYVAVEGYGIGTYTLTVTGGEETEQLDRDDATVAPTATPTPEPPPAADPTELGVAGFLQQCEQATEALAAQFTVGAIDQNQMAQSDDLTFGNMAEMLAAAVDSYSELEPPQELQDYHGAWLAIAEVLLDHVRTRPSQESFLEELMGHYLTVFIAAMEIGLDPDKSEEEIQRLVEVLYKEAERDFFGPDFLSASEAHDEALAKLSAETSALLEGSDCYFEVSGAPTEAEVGDDHGDTPDNGTSIEVGEIVEGRLEAHDTDYFRFTAEEGQFYQIDVALGTLDDSIVYLYDGDGSFLDNNDDHGGTYASRLFWEAPSSGERYVTVEGYGIGTYTLTVSIIDDRGDTAEDGGGVASDQAALVALYNATEGESWTTRTNWLSGRPLDEWHGVTTDSDGRVTELNLSSNQLGGALPAELGDLTNLESLRLWDNQLTGRIPAKLGDLTNLKELDLGGNGSSRLTGRIPAELGDLTNLESLDLINNELTGRIPAELGDLANLRELNLAANRLTGPIPAELGDLANLESLDFWSNQLTGPIPADLGDLANLRALLLGSNQLAGPIPAELGDLTNLESLSLGSNQLAGPIPAELGDLTNLRVLNFSGNQLTGRIPAELGDLANLRALNLDSNQLTGPIPAELGDLTNLRVLNFSGNQLTGRIPAELGDLANLRELNLSGNQLTGPIPAELGDLSNLQSLSLGWNELTGRIPAWLGDLSNLELLVLSGNELTGPIPADLGDLSNLKWLYLSGNQLTGRIPAWLGDLSNLRALNLGSNQLTGRIPAELGDLSNLQWLVLSGNQLTGLIPAELGDLTNLQLLNLGVNQLTGRIPAELGDLTNLVELKLSGNQLTGCVPVGLRDVAEENDLGELELPDCS